MIKRIILLVLILLPIFVWAAVKPVRVFAPGLVSGITCNANNICLDDMSYEMEATKLYDEAEKFVESTIGEIEKRPRIIFCSTESCFKSFGFNRASAIIIGKFGIIIGPKGWEDYYVRHEIIHHLQNERIGMLKSWLITPSWFKEGMAYSVSQHPRETLGEPWQAYSTKFSKWYESVNKKRLWDEANKL